MGWGAGVCSVARECEGVHGCSARWRRRGGCATVRKAELCRCATSLALPLGKVLLTTAQSAEGTTMGECVWGQEVGGVCAAGGGARGWAAERGAAHQLGLWLATATS